VSLVVITAPVVGRNARGDVCERPDAAALKAAGLARDPTPAEIRRGYVRLGEPPAPPRRETDPLGQVFTAVDAYHPGDDGVEMHFTQTWGPFNQGHTAFFAEREARALESRGIATRVVAVAPSPSAKEAP